jgi:predicted O-methyltransferase YrrM
LAEWREELIVADSGIYESLEIPEADRVTSIRKDEAEFIYQFLRVREIRSTLETGFAYGCSTAHIISATQSPHVAIDPYQQDFGDLGLRNIERLGLSKHLTFIREQSALALPDLLRRGATVDFAFIDGGHKFDEIFVDWFYSDLLLNAGGFIFFDDSWLYSTQRVASFIYRNRADYSLLKTPIANLVAFQKTGKDSRTWSHYENF